MPRVGLAERTLELLRAAVANEETVARSYGVGSRALV
jgi:hypothetical protein